AFERDSDQVLGRLVLLPDGSAGQNRPYRAPAARCTIGGALPVLARPRVGPMSAVEGRPEAICSGRALQPIEDAPAKVQAQCGGRETMRKAAFLVVFIAASVPQAASAHVVRHGSIPETYQGTWAPDPAACNDQKAIIVLTAKAYTGPSGSCVVDYVSE